MSFESLHMASTALRSQRLAMDVAARNLTGSTEPGYTRQVTVFQEEHTSPRGRYSQNIEGLGTSIVGIQRMRSELLDTAYRTRASAANDAEVTQPHLQDLESRLAATPGLSSLIQDLDTAMVQIQGDPGNLGLRQAYFRQLEATTAQIRTFDQEIVDNQSRAREDLSQQLGEANRILGELAELNPRLVASQPGTTGSNAMLDKQDRLLDQLSRLMDIQVFRQPAGNVDVLVGGSQVVGLNQGETLRLQSDNSISTSSGKPVLLHEGGIAALQQYVTDEVPAYRTQLDQMASSWIGKVNELHGRLYGLDGVTGRNLLNGTGSSDIALALSDPRQLGHAVARVQSTPSLNPPPAWDQALSGQSASLLMPPGASGSITINGTSISWNDGQSLQDILASFNSAGVKANYASPGGPISLERDPTRTGPSGITISDSSGNLAAALGLAGQPSSPGGSGDNAGVAALLQQMRAPAYGPLGDRSLQQSFRDLQSDIGSSLQTRQIRGEAAGDALQSADQARKSIFGVSSDEELLDVTRLQQAFAAAAKIATAADEMLTTLIQMGR